MNPAVSILMNCGEYVLTSWFVMEVGDLLLFVCLFVFFIFFFIYCSLFLSLSFSEDGTESRGHTGALICGIFRTQSAPMGERRREPEDKCSFFR